MRQAGRYLPEYREIRSKAPSFLDFCYSPALAAEATLQPIRRFGFDAAILFSDILVIPDALGQSVSFESGEGPRLKPIETSADLAALREAPDWSRLAPVFETVARARPSLSAETALIGFCGAPWTVASYMIAGRGTPDQAPARLFAYREPELFAALIDRLVEASAAYLVAPDRGRRRGGADVQLLVGRAASRRIRALVREAARAHRRRAALPSSRRSRSSPFLVARLTQLGKFARSGRPLGDRSGHRGRAARRGGAAACETGVARQSRSARARGRRTVARRGRSLAFSQGFEGRAHIFNLGHGILPETPIAHVERLMALVRRPLE